MSVCLLAVVVLVQVALRRGLLPGLAVGALLSVVGVAKPPPVLTALPEGAAVVVVNTFLVVIALAVRAVLRRQGALDEQGAASCALTFEHSPAGEALTDAAGRLRSVNPTLTRWCAAAPQALVGRYLRDLVDPAAPSTAPPLRASVGLRRVTAADHDALTVVRDADAALYRVKHDGGYCVRRAEVGEGEAVRVARPQAQLR